MAPGARYHGRKVPEGGFAAAIAVMTEILALMRGVRRIDGQTVIFEGTDMLDVARFFEVVHHIRSPH